MQKIAEKMKWDLNPNLPPLPYNPHLSPNPQPNPNLVTIRCWNFQYHATALCRDHSTVEHVIVVNLAFLLFKI